MVWQALILVLLIVLNGFFALSELAVVSSRRHRLEARAEAGSRGARKALELAANPTDFLATVQVGITLIGIFAGAYGGATLSAPLAEVLRGLPLVGGSAATLAFALVVLATTYLSLIVGELVPKRIAMQNPEAIAAFVAPAMSGLARIGRPVVWFLSLSTDGVLRLLGVRGHERSAVTEEEVKALIAEGTESGVFREAERRMLEGVIRFADRPVRAIMVPRHAIVWLDAEDPAERAVEAIVASGHSRFPLREGGLDAVLGVVHVKDVLDHWRRGALDLRAIATEPLMVSETLLSLRLIELFRAARVHMGIVFDEYGAVEGLVTPTDVLTSIAGDLPDRAEQLEAGAVARPDGSWLLDGGLPVARLGEVLGIGELEGAGYATLAGLILAELEHLPAAGERAAAHGWEFEVVDLDGRRIDKVLARRGGAGADAT